MKKTFYYNFLLAKADEVGEEEAASQQEQVTGSLVEIRDSGNGLCIDPNNPWQIRKPVSPSDVLNGKLTLSEEEMLAYVFRYWTLDMANYVVKGNRSLVVLMDYTDETVPKKYQSDSFYVEKGPHHTYSLACMDLVRSRLLNPGDEIGLFWDLRTLSFSFKVLHRVNFT
ncbi:hypothetical protein REPUB_Repub08aG0211300 [Reevesia pubescens]